MNETTAFAIYRLPHQQQCVLVDQIGGLPRELPSCAELCGCEGFVMAPFAPSADCPILLLRPDRVTAFAGADHVEALIPVDSVEDIESQIEPQPFSHADYQVDFANFHEHLVNGEFSKLVLSRSVDIKRKPGLSAISLFAEACRRYPRVMVALVSTPQAGTWLTATPEILLSGSGRSWQTMALAGTMPYSDKVRWSDKNIQEQRYVATYVTEVLEHYTSDFTEHGPRTVRAAHLAHLRSDFHFTLSNTDRVGELIQALHPTPAVCGLPKDEARQFILANEHHERRYYSGFMGPLSLHDTTHLYVTLRCMQLFNSHCRLYAGGGILPESNEQLEWQETEAKLDTMRRLFQ